MSENKSITKLLEEAVKLTTGTTTISSYRNAQSFDDEHENWFLVVGVGKNTGFIELLQPSQTIVRATLPRPAAKHFKVGDLIHAAAIDLDPTLIITTVGRINIRHQSRKNKRKCSLKAVWYQPHPDAA